MSPGNNNLRLFGRLSNFHNVRFNTRSVLILFSGNLLWWGQKSLNGSQINQGVSLVILLDNSGNNVPLAPAVLLKHRLALGLPDPLQNYLFSGLRRDPAKIRRSNFNLRYLGLFTFFLDLLLRKDFHFASFRINLYPSIRRRTAVYSKFIEPSYYYHISPKGEDNFQKFELFRSFFK